MQTQMVVALVWLWLMFNLSVFQPWNLIGWELGVRLARLGM